MEKQKYILFVWAKDVGKFVKDYMPAASKQKTSCELMEVLVLGNELKIEDLKALMQLEIQTNIDKVYADNDRDTELIFLGRCLEVKDKTAVTIVPYVPLSKDAKEIAKRLEIEVCTWETFTKTGKTTRKAKPEPPKEQKVVKLLPEEKESPVRPVKRERLKTDAPQTKSEKEASFLGEIIKKSSLSKEEKEKVSSAGSLALICSAVKASSDINIGLPFQLTMSFGKDLGEKLAKILSPSFEEIKAL